MRTHAERISYPQRTPVSVQCFEILPTINTNMWYKLFALLLVIGCIKAAPQNREFTIDDKVEKEDLKTAASSYSHQYSNWGGSSPGGYGYSVTGFGVVNDKYGTNYGGIPGQSAYPTAGYPGYSGGVGYVGSAPPLSGAGYVGNAGQARNSGFGGYKGYGGYSPNLYGGNGGYGDDGYGSRGSYGGNGGYGGYGGNGGLSSYSGYNNPYYQGSNHLGYGYYQPGNIYKGGSITPSFVNGYRGYTRR